MKDQCLGQVNVRKVLRRSALKPNDWLCGCKATLTYLFNDYSDNHSNRYDVLEVQTLQLAPMTLMTSTSCQIGC